MREYQKPYSEMILLCEEDIVVTYGLENVGREDKVPGGDEGADFDW